MSKGQIRWCIVMTEKDVAFTYYINHEVKDSDVFRNILTEFDAGDEYSVEFTCDPKRFEFFSGEYDGCQILMVEPPKSIKE